MKRPKLPVTDWFRADAYHPALPGFYEAGKTDGHISPMRRYWDGSRWLVNPENPDSPSLYMQDDNAVWRGVRMWVLVRIGTPHQIPVYCVDPAAELPTWSLEPVKALPYKTRAAAMRAAGRFPALGLGVVLA